MACRWAVHQHKQDGIARSGNGKPTMTQTDKDFILSNYDSMYYRDIAAKLGGRYTVGAISGFVQRRGLRKAPLNKDRLKPGSVAVA